ncbi:MAG: twin transmembrane helix small protein [Sterolibacterium sp.]
MKIIVIVLLLLIVASLGSALFFLFSDKSGSARTVRALTVRISLSLLLFAVLMAGYHFGLIGSK